MSRRKDLGGVLALKIGLGGWLRWSTPILLDPTAQRRDTDPKIRGRLLVRSPQHNEARTDSARNSVTGPCICEGARLCQQRMFAPGAS